MMSDEPEARLTEWRARGREKGRAFAAETKRGMATGATAETWARALAEATAQLANEYVSAGAPRDEVLVYVNELVLSFGETMATGDRRAKKGGVDPRQKSSRNKSRRRRGESPEPRSSTTTA
jgi:hypothetical protein